MEINVKFEMKRLSKDQLDGLNTTIKVKIANQVGFDHVLPELVSVAKTLQDDSEFECIISISNENFEWLTSALLLLRNACVSPAARAELLTASLTSSITRILDTLTDINQANLENHILTLKYSIQLLANGCTDLNFARQTWSLFFPGLLFKCINLVSALSCQGLIDKTGTTHSPFTHQPKLCDAISLTTLRCCQHVPGAAQALCSHADDGNCHSGAKLLEQLRLVCEATGDQNGSFQLLLEYICLHCGYLETLYHSAGLESFASFLSDLFPFDDDSDSGRGAGPTTDTPTNEDASSYSNNIPSTTDAITNQDPSVITKIETDAAKFTTELIDKLAKQGQLKDPPPQSSIEERYEQHAGRATLVRVLKYWKQLTAREDNTDQYVKALHEAGVARLLLSMLKAIQNNTPGPDGKLVVGRWRHLCPELEEEASYYPQASAQYDRFYKASILAILGNACYGRKYFQDAVASMGGVDLLLSQCRGDMSSPLSREWALWAVRNLCEGNPEVQAAIAELKQCPFEGQQQQQQPQMMGLDK